MELIDTCWDVNVKRWGNEVSIISELIDTCWDVNSANSYNIKTSSLN